MNLKAIGRHIFLSPLYISIIALLGCLIFAIGFALYTFVVFTFFSGWINFLWVLGCAWAFAIALYLFEKTY